MRTPRFGHEAARGMQAWAACETAGWQPAFPPDLDASPLAKKLRAGEKQGR